jgi:polar amino acid transport system substrate-binding protein
MRRRGIILCFLFFSIPCAFSQTTLRVTTIEYPPLYQDSPGSQGIACDLLREALKTEGVDIEYAFVPPLRMVNDIENNVTLSGLGSKLREGGAGVLVSEPIYEVRLSLIYDSRRFPNGVEYAELSDLSKYVIGVLEKSATENELKAVGGLRVIANTNNEGLAKQLMLSRIDLWATVDITGQLTLKLVVPSDYSQYASTKPFQVSEVNVIIPKNLKDAERYIALINRGIGSIKANGQYSEIVGKYIK